MDGLSEVRQPTVRASRQVSLTLNKRLTSLHHLGDCSCLALLVVSGIRGIEELYGIYEQSPTPELACTTIHWPVVQLRTAEDSARSACCRRLFCSNHCDNQSLDQSKSEAASRQHTFGRCSTLTPYAWLTILWLYCCGNPSVNPYSSLRTSRSDAQQRRSFPQREKRMNYETCRRVSAPLNKTGQSSCTKSRQVFPWWSSNQTFLTKRSSRCILGALGSVALS